MSEALTDLTSKIYNSRPLPSRKAYRRKINTNSSSIHIATYLDRSVSSSNLVRSIRYIELSELEEALSITEAV